MVYLQPRLATINDVHVLVRHRAEMFAEMGMPRDAHFQTMLANSERWFRAHVVNGTYVGFLIAPADSPAGIAAGAAFSFSTGRRPTATPGPREAISSTFTSNRIIVAAD